MTVRLAAAGRTDVGLVRRCNEDSFYVGELPFAVADGLGGHIAGDVASKTAISTLKLWDSVVAPANLPGVLGHAVSAANAALRHRIETEPGLAGMATTLVA